MYKCKYREALEFLKWMSSVERMSSAGGRLGTAPALLTAQTLAAAGHNRGPGRAYLSFNGVGVFCQAGGFRDLQIPVRMPMSCLEIMRECALPDDILQEVQRI